jgi:hypothetical protein
VYKSISIFNFKAFDKFNLEGLSPINIITGMNNVGKTVLLEAIFLLSGCENIELVIKINTFRGISEFTGDTAKIREAMWLPLFKNLSTDAPIVLEGVLQDGSKLRSHIEVGREKYIVSQLKNSAGIEPTSRGLTQIWDRLLLTFSRDNVETRKIYLLLDEKGVRIQPPPARPIFPGYFISSYPPLNPKEEAELFGQLDTVGESQKLVPILQILEPRLERLSVNISAGIPMIHGDIGIGRMLPLPLMGDGIRRITKILLAIGNAPNGVVLIDDLEFGIHHSNINKIWRTIFEAASRSGTQIFVTTHSYEWIRGAVDIFQESFIANLSLYRLERHNSKVEAISYDRESMSSAIKAELEVR